VPFDMQEEQQRLHASVQDLQKFDPSKVKVSQSKGADPKAGGAKKKQQAAQKPQQVSDDLINKAIDAATKSAAAA
jgi:hypothetical protein